ncbi:MAG TPA: outer membrane protein transport protein [Casimicrobiaceae bacterium]|nr:outer membrane protein transport protein [Casimicrobiaceae bacterium]
MIARVSRAARSCLIAMCLVHGPVLGAGFAIDFIGARSIGAATADGAAAADAATLFTNPAGLAYLDADQWIVGSDVFLFRDRFSDSGSTILGGALPTPGTNGADAIPTTAVPWIFGSHRINDRLAIGLGITAPFGLKTDYGNDFVGRYQNVLSSITVLDVNPAIAYRAAEWITLGAGVSAQYASARLTQAIDFGTICLAALAPATCAGAFGLVPGRSDGYTSLDAHDVAIGFNAGVMMEPRKETRLGISFRSSVHHHFDDAQQRFDVPAGARALLAAGGTPDALTGGSASTSLTLPARMSFAWREELTRKVRLFASATRTLWHVFDNTVVTPHDPATGAAVSIEQGYRDAWRFAVAADYALSDRWTPRGGIAYDETPIPARLTQAALPDRDRTYLTTGLSYTDPSSKWLWDVGYSYVRYAGRIPINRAGLTGDTLRGTFDVGGHVVAAQIVRRY